jgi:importin subunit beta-1
MGALKESLQDASANRDIKPAVISCFGDIAMAIGKAYEPYLQVSVMMLMQAAQQNAPAEDEELVIFINTLRLSILEAYTGIIMGLSDGGALEMFVSTVPAIMQFLQFLANPDSLRDDEVIPKAVGLIGDIAQQLGSYPGVTQQINQPFVATLLQECLSIPEGGAQEIAIWTRGVVTTLLGTA